MGSRLARILLIETTAVFLEKISDIPRSWNPNWKLSIPTLHLTFYQTIDQRESMCLSKLVLWCPDKTQKCRSITSSWICFPTPSGCASLLSVSMTSTKALKVLNTFFLAGYLSSNLQTKYFRQPPQESYIKEPNIPCPHPRTTGERSLLISII